MHNAMDYLNLIVTKPELFQHFSPSFIHELKDELAERAQTVDSPQYKPDDFELILEKEGAFPPVSYPSERLIRGSYP